MRVAMPRFGQPVIGDGALVTREWAQYFRELMGAMGFVSGAPVYSQLYTDGLAIQTAGAAVSVGTVATSLRALFFPPGTDETVYFSLRLPNDYFNGSDLVPFIDWCPTDTDTNDVQWELGYAVGTQGSALPAATTDQEGSGGSGVSEAVTRVDFDAITGTSFVRGDVLLCSIARLGTDAADTYSTNAALLGVGFKYEIEGFGTVTANP